MQRIDFFQKYFSFFSCPAANRCCKGMIYTDENIKNPEISIIFGSGCAVRSGTLANFLKKKENIVNLILSIPLWSAFLKLHLRTSSFVFLFEHCKL